jgi:hypothetical protein
VNFSKFDPLKTGSMKCSFTFIFLFQFLFTYSQDTGWKTWYELSGGTETPRYDRTIGFCKRLDEHSLMVTYTSFGKSAQGRDLPLLMVDKDGLSGPAAIRAAGRIIVLIQACIHPGESEGKDAGLMFIRDLVVENKYPGLLDHVSILFIPIFNVDGHERFGPYNRINQNGPKEMGWRVNANNLNLNRDYLKTDTPEMVSWLQLFSYWMPDFFIDTHTTDGADYQYILTYSMETEAGLDAGLNSWTKDIFLKSFKEKMESAGYPVFPYVDFRKWYDPQSGLITEASPPMFSQGYTAMRNRPGLLIETHMLKPYNQRVTATYESLKVTLSILDKDYRNLQILEAKADKFSASEEFRAKDFPLQFSISETDSTMVEFLGIEYTRIKSDITGEYWYKYGTAKKTFLLPWFNIATPVVSTRLPEVYIVPVEWSAVIDRLAIHGIKFHRLTRDTIVQVSSYKFRNPKWQANPYEGRHPMVNIELTEIIEPRKIPAGSAIVSMDQPSSRIIAHILEPKGNGSYVYWGFFDAVLEQKEYAEQYVVEPLAAKMLSDDPLLKAEFEQKKADDTVFARNPNLILRWFLSKTPYWDSRKDVYPVGKIFDKTTADVLLKE